jgi:hypothetical protein
MPCIILLLQTQHSRLFEAAQTLTHAAGAGSETWPGDLYAFRHLLIRHDRMERDVFQRLDVSTDDGLSRVFDDVLASQPGLDASAVAAAARRMSRIIEVHADAQETDLFPDLIESYRDSLRHQLGDHYARIPADQIELGEPAAA